MTSLPDLVLTCVSCNEPCAPQSFVAACEHAYCNVCLTSYVESGLQTIGAFPPQCCSVPITLQLSRTHLTPQIIERYEAKQAEIAAVCSLLCAEPGCRIIIPKEKIIENVGLCPGCNRGTCANILGAENPGARRAIYERRTIFRADKALDRYHKHLKQTWGAPDPRPREEQLAEVREAIENGCDHGYWTRVETRGHCKMCKYVGRRFIFQCINCDLTSCWACHTDEPPEYRRVLDETEV